MARSDCARAPAWIPGQDGVIGRLAGSGVLGKHWHGNDLGGALAEEERGARQMVGGGDRQDALRHF